MSQLSATSATALTVANPWALIPPLGNLDLRTLLHVAIQNGASDIHVAVGMPPTFRIHGELLPLKTPDLGPADTRRLLFGLLSTSQREAFELERELDCAITLTGKYRCRVNAHYPRGTVALAMSLDRSLNARTIPNTVPNKPI